MAPWLPASRLVLGTDGFGRSDTREALRHHFEVSGPDVAYATLYALMRDGALSAERVRAARDELQINPDKPDSMIA